MFIEIFFIKYIRDFIIRIILRFKKLNEVISNYINYNHFTQLENSHFLCKTKN